MANRSPNQSQNGFDPGLSFTGNTESQADETELPSWLRTFGEASGGGEEPSHAPDAGAPAARDSESLEFGPAGDDIEFPKWMETSRDEPRASAPARAAEQQPPPTASAGRKPLAADMAEVSSASFLSDDDLPDWLRTVNAQHTPTAGGDSLSVAMGPPPSGSRVAPSVSNIWGTGRDAPAASSGASLFATIANAGDDRLQEGVAYADEPADTTPVVTATPAAVAPAQPPARPKSGRSDRTRLWLIAGLVVLICLMLILLSMAQNT